uniref:Uncharacterized protein n=1 Tax=Marseillevirus LCMAC201 TaxID=2506605 RepID=A0A481YWL2_9VIRU|nr:MAG: hypothetical protein LCMAC201_01830 [Marseillevirus LCMAC201]
MSKDYVSLVNLWCQKNTKSLPEYNFVQIKGGWSCNADWIDTSYNTSTLAKRSEAKAHKPASGNKPASSASRIEPKAHSPLLLTKVDQKSRRVRLLPWSASVSGAGAQPRITGESPSKKDAKQACAAGIYNVCKESSVKITCLSGTCLILDGDQRADCWKWLASPEVEWDPTELTVKVYTGPTTPVVQSTRPIKHIRVNSPSRDAADAKILMDLGAFLAIDSYKRYVVVSSDHILVQAALDTELVSSAGDLSQLRDILSLKHSAASGSMTR